MSNQDSLKFTEIARHSGEETGEGDEEQDFLLSSDTSDVVQALHALTSKAGPAASQFEESQAWKTDRQLEPASSAIETARDAPGQQAAPKAKSKTSKPSPTWLRAISVAEYGGADRKPTRMAILLTLGLTLLATGFVVGRGGAAPTAPGHEIVQNVLSAQVRSLRAELAGARHQIATLNTALEIAEKNENRHTTVRLETQQGFETEPEARLSETAVSQQPSPELAAVKLNATLERIIQLNSKLRSLNVDAESLTDEIERAGHLGTLLAKMAGSRRSSGSYWIGLTTDTARAKWGRGFVPT